MIRLVSAVLVLTVIQHGVEASPSRNQQVLDECRTTYSAELDNDYLIGEWFEVMKFTYFGGLTPSTSCTNQVFYKATAENLTVYEQRYEVAVSMDDNPLLINRANGWSIDLVAGKTQAKDFFSQPVMPYMTINNYKRLTDDYVLVWDCALRGNTIWLHSRIQHPTNEDIDKAIEGVPELERLMSQRYCWV